MPSNGAGSRLNNDPNEIKAAPNIDSAAGRKT
jgi:hypothetical protein